MRTKRVLVIDDEPDVQTVVRGCLEDIAGWEVITATSGQEGLVKAMADLPDAIVLDVMMPGMDGLTFLQTLRTQESGPSIPVVLLTAKVNWNQDQDLPKLAVRGIVPKPFDPFLLTETIATFLGWTIH